MSTRPPEAGPLAELVGPGAVRAAGAADAIGDLRPSLVVRPGTALEVAAVLRAATERGWAVVPRGGGTTLLWGGRPHRCDVVLDTTGLDALVEHAPADLVCVAGAGMRLGALQATVGAAPGFHQRLMLDPPQGEDATLGGLVATRASGPLRQRYGTMRDLLIGAQFVLADGTVARTGGKVAKNVAGYDLDKLLVGSLGTLAVIVEVALRLHPVPPVSRTVVVEGGEPRELVGFLAAVRRAPVVPSLLEVLWPDRVAILRVDSSTAGAERQAGIAAGLDPGAGVVDGAEAAGWADRGRGRPWRGEGLVAGVGVPLAAIAPLLEAVEREHQRGGPVDLALRGGLGVGEIRLAPDPAALERVRLAVEGLGGHLDLRRRPAAASDLRTTPPDPVARELMGAVKGALDLGGTLSPGRLGWAG